MKQFTSKTQRTGEIGEIIAAEFLKRNDYRIVEKNFTTKLGEIDIIATKNNKIHFIEVKSITINSVSYETYNPAQNLTRAKFNKIKNTVKKYLTQKNVSYETEFQIDLYCVFIDRNKKNHKIRIIENITDF